ncbi:hypothetical protein D6C86_06722 [Aureobasidium pullulans]|nr:hypothetical protein D6C86_06722 [Aureobasidium pullulans]
MSPRVSLEYQRVLAGAISDCPRSSPTVDALWETAQTHGSFISTRDDLSRKVAVGRARDKTGGEENIGRRYFPNGQKSWPATDRPTSFKIHH